MQKLLLLSIFTTLTNLAFSQCQSIEAIIANSSPTIMPADTGWIDLCVGEILSLEGTGIYDENGQTYQQTDSMSIFKWNFGDGNEAFGNLTTHFYDTPGAYFVNLVITDTMGCENQNTLNQRVRVHGFNPMLSASISENPICAGNSVTLEVAPDSSTTYNFTQPFHFINSDTLPIPDGDGNSVLTTITINGFPQGATLENINQLNNICINMEHSWMRDLLIELTAPNGTTIILHDHPGQTGGQIFLGEPIDNDGGFPELGIGYDYCWAADAPNSTWIEYSNTNFPGTLPADTYSSFDPISNLLGTPLNGNWTLTITDLWASDNGALFYWSLLFNEEEFTSIEEESFDVNLVSGEWLPDNSIVSNNENAIVATPTQTTTYTYQTTDDFGCVQNFNYEIIVFPAESAACQPCDSIIVTLPETQMFTCTNNGFNTLTPTVEAPINELDFQWTTVDGNFANPDMLNNVSVDILGAGTYILMTSVAASGCSQMDTIVVTPTVLPNLTAGEDITLFCSIPQYFSLMGITDGTDVSFPLWTTPNGEITFGANTFQPTIGEPGTYFLTILDNISNCVVRDTVEVFLHPQLIDSIAVVDADCNQTNGSATIFSAANPADLNIEWSNGETTATITDLATGNYTVTLTDGNCTQEAIVFVEESDFCEVIIRGKVYQGETCNSTDAQLDWFNDFMTIELWPLGLEIHEPMPDGSYEFIVPPGEYTVIMDNGPYIPNNTFAVQCPEDNQYSVSLPLEGSVSEGNDFFWQLTVGTDDLNQNINPLQISPNPTNDHFQIHYTLPTATIATLEVFSLSGKLVRPVFDNKNKRTGEHTEDLNIGNLPNGVYLIRLETEDSVFFERVVKQ